VLLGFAAVRFLKSGTPGTAIAATTSQPNIGGTRAGM
jgi:hypothetical protein